MWSMSMFYNSSMRNNPLLHNDTLAKHVLIILIGQWQQILIPNHQFGLSLPFLLAIKQQTNIHKHPNMLLCADAVFVYKKGLESSLTCCNFIELNTCDSVESGQLQIFTHIPTLICCSMFTFMFLWLFFQCILIKKHKIGNLKNLL